MLLSPGVCPQPFKSQQGASNSLAPADKYKPATQDWLKQPPDLVVHNAGAIALQRPSLPTHNFVSVYKGFVVTGR